MKNILNVTHLGAVAKNCPEIQQLMQSIIKGAGVSELRIEGFSDIENILQEVHYRLQSSLSALNIATRARNQLNAKLTLIDRWVSLINLM